ncbi:MAG: sugar transferase [Phycisphaerales bacterium JB060]
MRFDRWQGGRAVCRRAVKRGLDAGVASAGLVLLSPLMLIIVVLVRRDSPGPAIYRSQRLGRDGHAFTMLKFRSMREETSPSGGAYHDRITRVGRLLRRYKLDELPQLVNVLRGDMSLVGPRPEPVGSTLEAKPLPVRPGLTDYASIVYIDLDERLAGLDPQGTYDSEVVPTKIRLREAYVRDQSTRGDLKIMAGTCVALVGLGRRPSRKAAAWNR